MTLQVKSILIEVLQHPTEEKTLILSGIEKLVSSIQENLDPSNINFKILTGYHKNEIILHSLNIEKKRLVIPVFTFLIENLEQDWNQSLIEEKISENGDLHLRLDKQELIGNENFILLDSEPDSNKGIYKVIVKFSYHGKKSEKRNAIIEYIKSFFELK